MMIIIVNTYYRSDDPHYLLPYHQSFTALSNQTYKNWILALVGDGLDNVEMKKVHHMALAADIPREKIIIAKSDPSKREQVTFKNVTFKSCNLHCFAGAYAANYGINIAINHPHVTPIAWWNDDDSWHSNHLEYIAK